MFNGIVTRFLYKAISCIIILLSLLSCTYDNWYFATEETSIVVFRLILVMTVQWSVEL